MSKTISFSVAKYYGQCRCSPLQDQDFNKDDTTPTPRPSIWFAATYLGLRPELPFIFADNEVQQSIDRDKP